MEQARPVPAPRRLYPELRPANYENIEIRRPNSPSNNINHNNIKKLNINAENLHGNCAEKKLPSSGQNKLILQENNSDSQQPIYGPDANENVQEPVYATPRPAPRQRLPPAGEPEDSYPDPDDEVPLRILRAAPQIPPKPLNILLDQRSSICSEVSTTSVQTPGKADEDREGSRYASNASLDCSESSHSGKFKSQSPGYVDAVDSSIPQSDHPDPNGHHPQAESSSAEQSSGSQDGDDDNNLLRSLGTTSKLLGEAIGERITFKAKGAKKRLDRNFKSSTEAISNIGADAGRSLKHASKRFGSNFSLGRNKDKADIGIGGRPGGSGEMDLDRRQTMPSTEVFNTIQFSSPLNRNGGLPDLRENDAKLQKEDYLRPDPDQEDDGCYEVPKTQGKPPSYDEALRSRPSPSDSPMSRNLAQEAAQLVQLRNQRQLSSSSSNGDESPRLPMPAFPPPRLSQQPEQFRMDALQPPVRQKRRKNYEHIELRRPPVDSAQLEELNRAAAAAEREESLLISAKNAEAETKTPKPERSDSWEFYGEDENEEEDRDEEQEGSSSPEPLYANQEATYGKLFEMATAGSSRSNVLTPNQVAEQQQLACITEDSELDACEGAVGGVPLPQAVIEEFDPLSSKCSTLARSNKSNELLLLEHLLEEDTYGTVKAEQDDVSMCTSEEEPTTSAATSPKPQQPQIVHQNARLLSDSMENMLDSDQERAKPYLSRMPESANKASGPVDLASASRNRTNWFVPDKASCSDVTPNTSKTTPPIEGDSPPTYLEAIGGSKDAAGNQENRSTIGSRFRQTINAISNVKLKMDAMKRKASFRGANQRQSDVRVALQMVPRPSLSPLLIRYEGPLVRFPSGVVEDILKEMQNRKAILRERQFQTFLDQEMKTPREMIPLDTITTLQCVSNSRVTDTATHFYCFEITTSQPKNGNGAGDAMSSNPNLLMTSSSSGNVKQQRVSHLYGVGKESERGVWMQKILESLTNSLPVKYTCHYYRAGWCYLKNSITSEWSGTWLVLRKSQRRLIFVSEANGNVEKMDLRKARCIVLKESDESIDNLHVESGPMLMIDCPPYAVYMIMSSARETKIWRHIIREVAHNNGFSLGDQQLTRYDVPVIVDKCINFVYIHGSMSEGIYRKSGSENSMHKLMSAFRADAFNVEITRNEYNEHDVANVLKRFMRDLPERLLGKLTDSFVFVTELAVASEKIPIYRELLARLSAIERETLRRIVGHLVFISSQQAKNKMSVQNLTMIWGPTLLAKKSDELIYSQKEADVLSDLVVLYKNLFPCSADEIKREQAMLACLQKYYAAAETLKDAVKQSGDIKIWISLNPNPENKTEEKTQVNATISPTKTAYELCREYSAKMQLPTHQLTLYEVILNDSLERPLHHDTKVFDVILNWSYWPEEDRKHNYLVVRPVEMLREIQRAVKNLATVTPGKELRFADSRTKTFKTLQCELRDGKIVVSKKDKNDKTTIVREIFLQSSTAYLGCERKRDFPWSWAITFVERTQAQIMRSRDAPFIGHVLAGSEWGDRTIWYSSIWYCLYRDNILPPAEIIIK
uniref:Rho GTPase activating protein at 15B, isoform C n=1 Tax=Drosophila melanogaster TaxID=7227 RepID=Q9VX92_DROME|nr:Rho GTPase activating protein at 15B, isoform C [Drosophila melanogaster]AAF48686.3 Rho GTPase activating protein at 15B, isoform C [Drosophila melanogaster]|eukprot:NP_573183.2 Rho GTPase activating protein at 15B, isoform C [Drosophila melanogaster]